MSNQGVIELVGEGNIQVTYTPDKVASLATTYRSHSGLEIFLRILTEARMVGRMGTHLFYVGVEIGVRSRKERNIQ